MEAKGKISFWDTGADGLGRLRALQACAQKWRHELERAPDAASYAAQLRCRWGFWREARGAKSPLAIKLELVFSFFCLVALFLFCLAGALLFVDAVINFGEHLFASWLDSLPLILLVLIIIFSFCHSAKILRNLGEKEREMESRALSLFQGYWLYWLAAAGAVYLIFIIFSAASDSPYISISAGVGLLCLLAFLYFYAGDLCNAFVYMLFLKEIKPSSYLAYEEAVLSGISIPILGFLFMGIFTI